MTLNCMNATECIEIIKILIAIAGICFVAVQINMAIKTKRATFFKELYTQLFDNNELRNIFLKIDYDEISSVHESRETEEKVDKLLAHCNLICYLYENKHLSISEIELLNYRFNRIFKSKPITVYLEFLATHYEHNKVGVKPFKYFGNYCLTTFTNNSNN